MGGTPFCKESSFKDTAKRHGRTMLVVRDAMLAERRNSKASSDLPKKIGTEKGEKKRKTKSKSNKMEGDEEYKEEKKPK